jgi:hypothetical protein
MVNAIRTEMPQVSRAPRVSRAGTGRARFLGLDPLSAHGVDRFKVLDDACNAAFVFVYPPFDIFDPHQDIIQFVTLFLELLSTILETPPHGFPR